MIGVRPDLVARQRLRRLALRALRRAALERFGLGHADVPGPDPLLAGGGAADSRQRQRQAAALEQLCRYITRPALANERVQTNAAGQVVLKLKTPLRRHHQVRGAVTPGGS